jgi:hypothetical protein
MINGKWMRKEEERAGGRKGKNIIEEDRNERRGGQHFGVSMLLDIDYY